MCKKAYSLDKTALKDYYSYAKAKKAFKFP